MLSITDACKLFHAVILRCSHDRSVTIDPDTDTGTVPPALKAVAAALVAAGLQVDWEGDELCYHWVGWNDASQHVQMEIADAYVVNPGIPGSAAGAIVNFESPIGAVSDPVAAAVATMVARYAGAPHEWKEHLWQMLDSLTGLPSGITQFVLQSDYYPGHRRYTCELTPRTKELATELVCRYPQVPVVDETASHRLLDASLRGVILRLGYTAENESDEVAVVSDGRRIGSIGF